jgi:sigma-B regulation protein RsbU (phosphoserine phosphatase)
MGLSPTRILLCAEAPAALEDVRRLLEEAGHSVGTHVPSAPDPGDLPTYRLIVLEGSQRKTEALQFCRRLRQRQADWFVPILFVTQDHSPAARLDSFEAGVDTYLLRPFDRGELLAQVRALLRIKDMHDHLTEKTAEVNLINRRLETAHKMIDQELDLARRIQQSFLPQSLPDLAQVRFAVTYRPCGRVGGDFYDAFRLDEDHVGFYIADAMGHGVPASLLTIFLKRGVRAKEIFGQQFRLVPPDEVLQRLNHDLLEQHLAENPFITMVYGLYHYRERQLLLSRAGHPHPLYVPSKGEPELWKGEGSLLGVFDTQFLIQTHNLQKGDKVLLYTDGIDGCVFENQPAGKESLMACAARHRDLPVDRFVQNLSSQLLPHSEHEDDVTLLAMEVTES